MQSDLGSGNDLGALTGCAAQAASDCAIMEQCVPVSFALSYGDLSLCIGVLTRSCDAQVGRGDNGVANAAACLTATTASCDSFFHAREVTPAACRRATGDVPEGGECRFSSQCRAGSFCRLDPRMPGCPGSCGPVLVAGARCGNFGECDTAQDMKCIASFSPDNGGSDFVRICQPVVYGGAGSPCFRDTHRACAHGFGCRLDRTCAPRLPLGANCSGDAQPLCREELSEFCLPDAQGTPVCTAAVVATVGEPCGAAGGGAQHQCDGRSICDAVTRRCRPRVPAGGPCQPFPDDCARGVQCIAGTCQSAPSPTCP